MHRQLEPRWCFHHHLDRLKCLARYKAERLEQMVGAARTDGGANGRKGGEGGEREREPIAYCPAMLE